MTRPREQGITQAPEFPEWRIFQLLKHHSLGLTKFEIVHFIDVSPELAAAALKRLQTSVPEFRVRATTRWAVA